MAIEVQPGAQTDRLIGVNPWRLRLGVAVRAQAQKGQANEAVLRLLSETLGMPRQACSIMNGHTSRSKTVRFEGVDPDALLALLEGVLEEA